MLLAIQCLCDDRAHHLGGEWTLLLLWTAAMAFCFAVIVLWRLWTRRAPTGLALPADLRPQALRCPFCHDALRSARWEPAVRCSACQVRLHAECWREHGGCTALGCRREGGAGREARRV